MTTILIAASLAALCLFSSLLTACGQKDDGKLVVGFAQIGAEGDWRVANTKSMQSEAEKRGARMVFVDCQGDQTNQIQAVRSFIRQKVDVIVLPPIVETGFTPVLQEARDAGIPVFLTDRRIDTDDESLYVTFIGADFVEEGRRAARWLADKTGGKAGIVELQGTPGAAPAIDRKRGFEEVLAEHPEMRILRSQSGDFKRSGGKEVMESFLKSPDAASITAVYAHNDDMAIGAIQAIEEAGHKPGTDVLVVSIDGVKAAFEEMVAGRLNCTVECNPLIGAQVFDAIEAHRRGETLARWIKTEESVFDQSTAAEALPTRQY